MSAIGVVLLLAAPLPLRAASIEDVKREELDGEWTHADSGERININGGDIQDSRFGQGRIAPSIDYASNFVVVFRDNSRCYYHISLLTGSPRINMQLMQGAGRSNCRKGLFTRVYSDQAIALQGFVPYTGPDFRAPTRQVGDLFPTGRWSTGDDGVTRFGVYGTLLGKPAKITLTPDASRRRFVSATFHMLVRSQVAQYRLGGRSGVKTGGGSTPEEVRQLCASYAPQLETAMIEKIGDPIGRPSTVLRHNVAQVPDQGLCTSEPGRWACGKADDTRTRAISFDNRPGRIRLDYGYSTSVSKAQNSTEVVQENETRCWVDVSIPDIGAVQ